MSFRSARKRAGFSIKEVAEFLNINRASVWNWETGKTAPHADILIKLAEKYRCSVDDLLRREE